MDKVCIMSFNPTGLGLGKPECIQNLLDTHHVDILLIQECWLFQSDLHKLGNIHKDYLFHGQSGMKDTVLLTGRPYGGIAILWHKRLAASVSKVNECKSNRMCAVKFRCRNQNILLVNCYMPNDNYQKINVSDDFLQTCDALECLISEFNDCSVIVGGDINLDYSRHNAHDQYFSHLLENCDMLDCWSLNVARQDYTYCDHFQNTSCIDRFSVSTHMSHLVKEMYPIDCALNTSYHRPICMTIEIEVQTSDNILSEKHSCNRFIA